MKKFVLITLLTFCGCSNSTFCNIDAAFNDVADVVADANSSFKKAEDKIFAVNPDNIIRPDPDPAKCPCKGTGNMFSLNNWGTANYDAALIAWSELTSPSNNVVWGVGTNKYSSAAASARNILTSTYNWVILDGGLL
jgi:hypothetical protein